MRRNRLSATKLSLLPLAFWCGLAMAAPAGHVSHLSGPLFAQGGNGAVRTLAVNSAVEEGDVLVTEKNTFARLRFVDGAEVVLRPASQLRLQKYRYEEGKPEADAAVMDLVKGGLRTVTGAIGNRGDRSAYRLETATATIGIRGTDYEADNCEENCGSGVRGTFVRVHRGAVGVSNEGGVAVVTEGQSSFTGSRRAPPGPPPQNFVPPRINPPAAIGQPGTQTPAGGGSCLVQ